MPISTSMPDACCSSLPSYHPCPCRYAYLTPSIHFKLASHGQYFVASGLQTKISKLELILQGEAGSNVDLVIDMGRETSEDELTEIGPTIRLPSIAFSVGPLPVTIGTEATFAARGVNVAETPTKLGMGFSATGTAELGFTFSDTLGDFDDCYCIN